MLCLSGFELYSRWVPLRGLFAGLSKRGAHIKRFNWLISCHVLVASEPMFEANLTEAPVRFNTFANCI